MKFAFKIFVKILVYSISLCCCIFKINCNNIIGCGGFIRTELKDFSFSKLSAHLLFSDGTLNYVTDILPNGAYSIPIYDFGSYIVKITGPEGWSVEPESGHRLEVNNQESCSEDYNFSFAGFSIFGKVSTAYINHGPPGIFIELLNNSQIISQTTTIDGGNFTINRVFPGNYTLHFKSETLDGKIVELNDTKYILEIKNDNLFIKDSFIIYGYPVIGDVKFYDDPIKDVEFFIFSKTITAKHFNFSRYNCISFKNIFDIPEYNALCKTISNYKGEFMFPLLPGGKYLIIPKYNTEVSSYDLHPENYSFEIQSSSVNLRSIFKIIGFSVIGKVKSFNGDPISNAEIYVDGKLLTKTGKDGNFSIKGVTNGSHKLSISLEGFIFNSIVVNFNPSHPNIGIFSPAKISICGSIIIQKFKSVRKEFNEFSTRRKILLINATSGDIVDHIYTQVQNSDKISFVDSTIISTFCFFSKPGLYIVKPILESPILALSLAPSKIKILLDSKPVTVKFSPFRGSISGSVKCLQKCIAGEFEVTLNLKEQIVDSIQLTQHVSIADELSNEGYFQFKDVIPGDYQIELISTNNHISLLNNRWCWSQIIFNVNIVDNDVNGLIFEQIGYSLPIQSSHDLKINYLYLNNSVTLLESKNLSIGLSQICLSNPGKYKIRVESCYKLENFSYFVDSREICGSHFDFYNPICHLKINVVEFKVRVNFELMKIDDATDLFVHVNGILDVDLNFHLKNIKWDNNKGYIDFWVKPDVSINVSVISSRYLVKPKTISLKLSKDTSNCLTKIGTFKLESGTFINGSIVPPIEGVFVEIRQKVPTLTDDDIEYIVASSKTNTNGHFGFGPLNSSYKYELKLSKNGYKIVENFNSGNNFYFKAYKLAELIVKVIDITGEALPGILLSIIGNDLRKNELTNEDGQFIFVGLTPGVYYLRAMMKELEFFPNGAVEVIIVEGSTENILIKATRTSFSLHGKVVSLNGEPEFGVTVESDPIKDFENYQSNCKFNLVRNEHATTDEFGIFRIRGLQPDCYYKLSINKIDMHDDYAIIRSYPKQIIIKMEDKDVHNIKIFALRNVNIREISAMVWTSEIYQSSLHLLVFPSDNPENIITAHKYNNEGIFFQMNLPPIHKKVEYVVRLQSNLNPSIYSNISAQEKTLSIETGETKSVYKHFEFHFYPVKKLLGESDITMTLSSSLILPCIILLISILFFQKDLLEPLISKIFKILKLYFLNSYKQTNITLHPSGVIKSNIFDSVEISELNDVIAKSKFTTTQAPTKKTFWSKSKKV